MCVCACLFIQVVSCSCNEARDRDGSCCCRCCRRCLRFASFRGDFRLGSRSLFNWFRAQVASVCVRVSFAPAACGTPNSSCRSSHTNSVSRISYQDKRKTFSRASFSFQRPFSLLPAVPMPVLPSCVKKEKHNKNNLGYLCLFCLRFSNSPSRPPSLHLKFKAISSAVGSAAYICTRTRTHVYHMYM